MIDDIQANRAILEQHNQIEHVDPGSEQDTANALHNSEIRLRMTLEAAHTGTWDWDFQTQELIWSEIAAHIHGFPSAGVVKFADVMERILPEDRHALGQSISNAVHRSRYHSIEYRILWPDGTLRWIAAQGDIIRDSNGAPLRIIGILRDITAQKQQELALLTLNDMLEQRVAERTMQLATVNAKLGQEIAERKHAQEYNATLAILGQQLNIATTSEAAARAAVECAYQLFGWDACFLLRYSADDDHFYNILSQDIVDGVQQDIDISHDHFSTSLLMELIANGPTLLFQDDASQDMYQFPRFGDVGRLSATMMFVPIWRGDLLIGVMSIQSYTPRAYTEAHLRTLQTLAEHCSGALQRIWAEEQLRETEARYRLLVEQTPAISYLACKDEAKQLLYISPQVETLLGFSATEWLADPGIWRSLIHPTDGAPVFDRIIQSGGTITQLQAEYRMFTRDGRTVWFRDDAAITHDRVGKPIIQGMLHNITQQKMAETALRESEERFRQITENINKIFWMTSHDYQQAFYISPAYEQIWGHSCASFYEQPASYLDAIHPEDRERVITSLITQIGKESDVQGEFRIIRPDGEVRWIAAQSFPVRNQDGQVYRIAGFAEDITERQQIKAAIQHNAQFEHLIMSISTKFMSLSINEVDESIRNALAAIGSFMGLDRAYVFLSNEQGNALDNTQVWCAPGIQSQNQPFQTLSLEPDVWWIEHLQAFEHIHIPRVAAMPPDMRVYQAMLQAQHIQSILVIPMVYGNKLMGFLGCESQRAEVRWSDEDIAWLNVISEIFVGTLQRIASKEALSKAKDQLEIRVAERTLALQKANEQLQRELGERERVEMALKSERASLAQRIEERTAELITANAELARASRLKDEFLASMSHELRTPLNTILGMAETLQEEIYGPVNDDQGEAIHSVIESGRHLLALINDILDLSKIEAGKLDLDIDAVPVEQVCQASLRLVKQTAHQKNIKVSFSIDSRIGSIQGDQRRIKQILVNLLSNAVKFTLEGGSIGLDVTGDSVQRLVHFTVWDTGIGVASESLEKLFQPFVQLDSRLAREYAGTGLGLVLVARMAKLHGGEVNVASKLREGSRFTVTLPWDDPDIEDSDGSDETADTQLLNHATTVVPSVEPVSAAPKVRQRILLADDHYYNASMMMQYLELHGYQVILARDGAEAVERTLAQHPDLILMDIQMPGMDGLEATRRIRAEPSQADTPIIALTALAMQGDQARCLEAGANQYLSKPIELKSLLAAIKQVLR